MSELNFKVDKEKCIKCGLCVSDCCSQVLKTDENGFPYTDAKDCFKCQHCLAVCPQGAVSVFDKIPGNSILPQNLNSEDLLSLIANRRSCRHYRHENVEKETIQKLKDMLAWVPTGCNFRDLHFSIVEDVTVMDSIRKTLLTKLAKILKILPVRGVLAKYKSSILEGKDMILQEAPHMLVVSVNKNAPCKQIDPIIALSYFELYAQSLGLGTLWCGLAYATLPMSKSIMKRLAIPNTHKLSYVMLFGKPDIKFARSTQPEKYEFTVVK